MREWSERMDPITKSVQAFYERYPFPASSVRSKKELMKRPAVRVLSSIVGQLFPDFKTRRFLDVGCGTGEIACGVARKYRIVTGIDISRISITKAQQLKHACAVSTVTFQKADIFTFEPRQKFDLVYAWGVLHHTKDPVGAFGRMVSMTKERGYCIALLYHRYGGVQRRLMRFFLEHVLGWNTQLQQWCAERFCSLGPTYQSEKHRVQDTYFHPHEVFFDVSEARAFFQRHGMQMIGCAPPVCFDQQLSLLRDVMMRRPLPESLSRSVFRPSFSSLSPTHLELWWSRLLWMLGGMGYFIVVGKKDKVKRKR